MPPYGGSVRIRLPGGYLTPTQIGALGTGPLQLTPRGAIETDVGTVGSDAGLPAIVSSPLSGRVGDHTDIRGVVRELDSALATTPELSRLPDGFWFSLDDGRGDVAGLGADLGALCDGDRAHLLIGGRTTHLTVDLDDVVEALVGAAVRAAEPSTAAHPFDDARLGAPAPAHAGPPIGWLEQNDGRVALGAGVPGGVLSAELAQYLAAIDRPIAVTPWRSVIVVDLDEGAADVVLRVLAPKGLVFDADSPLLDLS